MPNMLWLANQIFRLKSKRRAVLMHFWNNFDNEVVNYLQDQNGQQVNKSKSVQYKEEVLDILFKSSLTIK